VREYESLLAEKRHSTSNRFSRSRSSKAENKENQTQNSQEIFAKHPLSALLKKIKLLVKQ
jgi:hypothetical protein